MLRHDISRRILAITALTNVLMVGYKLEGGAQWRSSDSVRWPTSLLGRAGFTNRPDRLKPRASEK